MSLSNINNSRAVLDIRSTPAKLNIQSHQIRFRVHSRMPQMTVHRRAPQFRVNWAKVRAENGLAGPGDFSKSLRDQSRAKVYEAIERIAQNGDLMMRTEHHSGRDMVSEIAFNNMEASIPSINIVAKSLPEVTWDNGEFQIVWSDGSLDIEWDTDFMPDINVTPHSVEIKVRHHPKQKITEPKMPRGRVDETV